MELEYFLGGGAVVWTQLRSPLLVAHGDFMKNREKIGTYEKSDWNKRRIAAPWGLGAGKGQEKHVLIGVIWNGISK